MTGGWHFVEAAYAIAYGSLALYGLSTILQACRAFAPRPNSSLHPTGSAPQDHAL